MGISSPGYHTCQPPTHENLVMTRYPEGTTSLVFLCSQVLIHMSKKLI